MTTTQTTSIAKAAALLDTYTRNAETDRNGRGAYYAKMAAGQARRLADLVAAL